MIGAYQVREEGADRIQSYSLHLNSGKLSREFEIVGNIFIIRCQSPCLIIVQHGMSEITTFEARIAEIEIDVGRFKALIEDCLIESDGTLVIFGLIELIGLLKLLHLTINVNRCQKQTSDDDKESGCVFIQT